MSNYTEQEVQAAVEKVIRSTVRHPTGILGERQIDISFSDSQEAAAGVYILYFNAPFYTLYLGVKRLLDAVGAEASTLESLVDAVEATDRLVTPIKDLSPLANAKAALEELEAAVSSRSQGFQDIEQVPAYRRYVQNLDGFLGQVGTNIKTQEASPGGASSSSSSSAGTGSRIVDTPGGARSKIPSLVRELVSQHQEVIRRVKLLAGAMADFSALNLPQIAAQGIISRARDVLEGHFNALSALDENTRLEGLRGVVLDLLAQKPLVKKYGAAVAPGQFIVTSGLARAFADAEHPALPAQVTGDKFGPYNITEDNQLINLAVDGAAPFDYPLPTGYVAELNGTRPGPWALTSDSNTLRILFGQLDTGGAAFVVTLTPGTRTAQQVAAEVNAELGASALVAEAAFFPLRFSGPVSITSTGGNNGRFELVAGDFNALGVVAGDELDVKDGPNLETTWTITSVDASGLWLLASSVQPAIASTSSLIEIGPADRILRLRDTDPLGSMAMRRAIRLPSGSPEENLTAALLGFAPGMEARSLPVGAKAIADNINLSLAELKAEPAFIAHYYEGLATTVPADPTRLVLLKESGSGTTTGGFVVSVSMRVFTNYEELVVGDRLIIRSSTGSSADVGIEGEITFISGPTFNVDFGLEDITAGDITYEVGPSLDFRYGDVVYIDEGSNQGRYTVAQDPLVGTTSSFELVLDRPLVLAGNGPEAISFEVRFGSETVTFKSQDVTLNSSVHVDSSPGAFYLFTTLPAAGAAKCSWLKFDNFPLGASAGDLVQLFVNSYNVVDDEYRIIELQPSLSLLELDSTVAADFELTFDFDVPNPFGRIRLAQVANYNELKERLDMWLARPEQQELYFRDLARLLNPIVTNANPTAVMVNDAVNHLNKLYEKLVIEVNGANPLETLEYALMSYEAPAQEPVDVLLSTFRQKGADRAIDLLLEGQFSAFFNLGVDGVSYSGELMKNMRAMAREDLPVRKFNRREMAGERLIGSIPNQKDFEFSTDDADSPDTPELPATGDTPSPGENY